MALQWRRRGHRMLYLYFFLWIAPHACLAIAVLLALSKGIQKYLPFFFSFLVYEVFSFAVGFACYAWAVHWHKGDPTASMVYHWDHLVDDGLAAVLKIAALYEVATLTLFSRFSPSDTLRTLFRWTSAALVLTAVAFAAALVSAGQLHILKVLGMLDFSVGFVEIGLLLTLLVCTKFLSLSWENLPAGVALGFGLQSCAVMAASALMVRLGKPVYVSTDLVTMGAFQICAIVWLSYIVLSPSEAPTETNLDISEIEALGQDMRRLMSEFPETLRSGPPQ